MPAELSIEVGVELLKEPIRISLRNFTVCILKEFSHLGHIQEVVPVRVVVVENKIDLLIAIENKGLNNL